MHTAPIRAAAPDSTVSLGLAPGWRPLSAVFAIGVVFLLLTMSFLPQVYDEGLMLTAGFRVASGQVPHQDFYAIYGPGSFYLLAACFRAFGERILVERVAWAAICAGLLALLYYAVRPRASLQNTVAVIAAAALSMFYINATSGYAMFPASFMNITSILLLLHGQRSAKWLGSTLLAGIATGVGTLFRYDTGLGMLGVVALFLAIARMLTTERPQAKISLLVRQLGIFSSGFLLALSPFLFFYGAVKHADFGRIWWNVVGLSFRYYRAGRELPFPNRHTHTIEDFVVYAVLATCAFTLYVVIRDLKRKDLQASERQEALAPSTCFLIAFCLYAAVMFLKGLVRTSFEQDEMAMLPALMLLAVLCSRKDFGHWTLRTARLLGFTVALCTALAAFRQFHSIIWKHHSTIFQALRTQTNSLRSEYCARKGPLTSPICFVDEGDRAQAMFFIEQHTSPQDSLYVGLTHHRRIYEDNNMFYFGTQRLPATYWSHFDPYIQNSRSVQEQIIGDLKREPPPYVVLTSEFEGIREANGSAYDSGVTLLDEYLHANYSEVQQFGRYFILKRNS